MPDPLAPSIELQQNCQRPQQQVGKGLTPFLLRRAIVAVGVYVATTMLLRLFRNKPLFPESSRIDNLLAYIVPALAFSATQALINFYFLKRQQKKDQAL